MRTYGVVLAGGIGERLGLDTPKQFVKVAGKSILEHTVAVINAAPQIDEVIVMITPGWADKAKGLLGNRFAKLTRILEGGVTRSDTTRLVLDAIVDKEAKLLLHDAVRPLVTGEIVASCIEALDKYAAVDVVIPSADTIVQVDDANQIAEIPDRSGLRRGQTPQAFWLSVLRSAYDAAARDPDFRATDDCGVVRRYRRDVPIVCVTGSEDNIKVTHPVDLYIADRLFQLRSARAPARTKTELAKRLKRKVMVVIGASCGIGSEIARLAADSGMAVVPHSRSLTDLHVEDAGAVGRALQAAAASHGRIDAVVVTAGVLHKGALTEMSPEDATEAIAVNYMGPVNVARAAYPYLAASHGHLLLFTSSSYTRGRKDYSLYSSSKAAVVNLAQALSDEWSKEGIKVNVVNPERTLTPMRVRAFGQEDPDTLLAAEAVASTSLEVLASDMTGFVVDVRRDQRAE